MIEFSIFIAQSFSSFSIFVSSTKFDKLRHPSKLKFCPISLASSYELTVSQGITLDKYAYLSFISFCNSWFSLSNSPTIELSAIAISALSSSIASCWLSSLLDPDLYRSRVISSNLIFNLA